MQALDFIINAVLRQPAIFLGLVVLLGGIFRKQKGRDIIVSVLKTVVGVRVLQTGTGLLVSASNPMMNMLVKRFAMQGRVADPWTGVGEALKRLDPYLAGQIGLIMIGAWLIHLLLSRLTPLKVVYLTGHVMYTDTAVVTWGIFSVTKWADWRGLLLAIAFLAFYWWFGPSLIRPWLKRIVQDDPLTLGHNMCFAGIITMFLSKITGDAKQSAQEWKLPGWLSVFADSVVAYSVIMGVLYTVIGIVAGPKVAEEYVKASPYGNHILYSFMQGSEIAVGVTILLLGVRMFLAELIPAFHGFAAVVVPGATAAVDNPVFWPYATQAALLGLIVTPIGMVAGILLQFLLGSTYLTVPSVIPIFFGGCTLGVFANAYGGWRGTIIACFLMGIVQVWGSSWFAWAVDFQTAGGGHTDFTTFWPAVFTVMRFLFGR